MLHQESVRRPCGGGPWPLRRRPWATEIRSPTWTGGVESPTGRDGVESQQCRFMRVCAGCGESILCHSVVANMPAKGPEMEMKTDSKREKTTMERAGKALLLTLLAHTHPHAMLSLFTMLAHITDHEKLLFTCCSSQLHDGDAHAHTWGQAGGVKGVTYLE